MAIVLDSFVLAEYMRRPAESKVGELVDSYPRTGVFLTTPSEAELWEEVYRLDHGRRRTELARSLDVTFRMFAPHVLIFDRRSAHEFAMLADICDRKGLGISPMGLQIAAIAKSRQMPVVTGNVADHSELGVESIDPWG